jgi:hypothetical protein
MGDRSRSGKELQMSRFIYMMLSLVTVGCTHSVPVQNRDEIIAVGDLVEDVKNKLRKWEWEEPHIAFAIAVKEEHESQAEFLERAEEIRRHNDFCEHPYYSVRPKPKVIASFSARDGKLIAKSKMEVLGPYAGNFALESGFRSVDATGLFSR